MSRSFCADSCSICCHPASCASATSASSPTGNALPSCRSAFNCSVTPTADPLRHHCPLRTSLAHSGTVQSAAEPCTSLNGSLPLNSCSALHLNSNSAQHDLRSTSAASPRAPARTEIPCLIGLGRLAS